MGASVGTAQAAGFGWGEGAALGDVLKGACDGPTYVCVNEVVLSPPNHRGTATAEIPASGPLSLHTDLGANILLVISTAMPPPSATSVVPFTIDDSSEARNRQQEAISSGVPARRKGTSAVARS
jgi:hypothetical protein